MAMYGRPYRYLLPPSLPLRTNLSESPLPPSSLIDIMITTRVQASQLSQLNGAGVILSPCHFHVRTVPSSPPTFRLLGSLKTRTRNSERERENGNERMFSKKKSKPLVLSVLWLDSCITSPVCGLVPYPLYIIRRTFLAVCLFVHVTSDSSGLGQMRPLRLEHVAKRVPNPPNFSKYIIPFSRIPTPTASTARLVGLTAALNPFMKISTSGTTVSRQVALEPRQQK